jgi:tetratricopeptide (TPR) repeat protein
MTASWIQYPYSTDEFDYPGSRLTAQWSRLHEGDREPVPDSAQLTEAWRRFHRGAFAEATQLGLELGLAGYTVANKAESTYAYYLLQDKAQQSQQLLAVAQRAEQAQAELPHAANAFYLQAYALGRRAQLISVTTALAEGVAGKVRAALERTLALEPNHADAHTALGAYHAELIDKLGGLIAGKMYGADREAALAHYQEGVRLAPHSISALTEYADGLLMLFGRRRLEEATDLYQRAVKIAPADALSRLDLERARAELE